MQEPDWETASDDEIRDWVLNVWNPETARLLEGENE